MTLTRAARLALPAGIALGLLVLLFHLFERTQSAQLQGAGEALVALRELRDLDGRWDEEARRLVAQPQPQPAASLAGPRIERRLRDLDGGPTGAVMASAVAQLARAAQEKRTAHDALGRAASALFEASGRVARSPASAPAAHALAAAVLQVGEAARRHDYVTFASRVDLTTRTLAQSLESTLDESHRWRTYLAFYAAALLLAIALLVARVAQARAALVAANERLEQRVAERTAELTRAMDQLRESEAQLVQTEKMSSLGQLVAGLAHEVNTPLAYVKNSVAALRDRLPELQGAVAGTEQLLALLRAAEPDPAQLSAAFEDVEARLEALAGHQVLDDLATLTRDGLHGIEQIGELVTNLRNFARLDRSRLARQDVNDCVRQTLQLAGPSLRGVQVEQRLEPLPPIVCAPSQVNQVLLNLVTNAAQATEGREGRVTISTRREGPGHVAVEVEDNGRGIAPDVMPRIFDPFFTTKDVGKGTGLGLSIAFKIVSQHGGRIDVHSEVGTGSRFTVILPIEPPESAP